jgi:hypothetical protein
MHEADIGKLLLAGEAARGLAGGMQDGLSDPFRQRRLPQAS